MSSIPTNWTENELHHITILDERDEIIRGGEETYQNVSLFNKGSSLQKGNMYLDGALRYTNGGCASAITWSTSRMTRLRATYAAPSR